MIDLKEAGLTDNEIKVYLALLDFGPMMAGQLSRKSGLHRRTVYDTTETLINKGFIGYIIQNNRRLFQASNPDVIVDNLKQKQSLLEPMILELKQRFQRSDATESTLFFKDKAGLKTVFEDQLNYKEILILGANPLAYDVLKFYFKWYDKARKRKKIKARIIAQDKRITRIPLAEVRYLPEKYSSPMSVNIYGDKTAIILWAKKPVAIVIKNKEISLGYRKYFELLWRIAK